MKKFRLPPGLGDELDEQLSIENKVSFWMIKRLHERGFSQIKTPLLEYFELFEDYSKEYVVATFLAVLEMAKAGELTIKQEKTFDDIICEVGHGK